MNKSQQRAFTLIEVIVAILIASMLGVLLFQTLNQTIRATRTVDGLTASLFNVVGFYDRFERDVCGAFIPEMGDPERVAQALEKKVQKQQVQQAATQQAAQKQGAQQPGQQPQEPQKPPPPITLKNVQVKKVFVCENKGNNVESFSFITCNPLQVYGQSKPRIARVIYTLVDDPRTPGTMKLLRKESPKLNFERSAEARSYVLLRNIKSLRLEFLAPEPVQETLPAKAVKPGVQPQSEKTTEKKQKPLHVYPSWPLAQDKAKDESGAGKKPGEKIRDLPRAVKVFLDYRDPFDEVIKHYEFLLPVYNYRPSAELMNIQIMQNLEDDDQTKVAGPGTPSAAASAAQPKGTGIAAVTPTAPKRYP